MQTEEEKRDKAIEMLQDLLISYQPLDAEGMQKNAILILSAISGYIYQVMGSDIAIGGLRGILHRLEFMESGSGHN